MKILQLIVVGLLLTAPLGVAVAASGGESVYSTTPGPAGADAPAGSVESGPTVGQTADGDADRPLTVLAIPGDDVERSDLRRQHADLGPASTLDTGETTDAVATRGLEADLADADTDAEREARIEEELDRIETRTTTLANQERRAVREFTADERDPQELLATLAEIDRAAATLEARTDRLADAAGSDDSAASSDRLAAVRYDLHTMQGPVRDHAADVLAGESSGSRVFVETGDDSVSLAAIDGDQYVRETTRADRRSEDQPELSDETVEELVVGEYPQLWAERTSFRHGPGNRLSVQLSNGNFDAFVDGGSESIVRDSQRVPLGLVGPSERTVKEQDGIEVTVRRTYIGGPMQLSVADADTGEPLSASTVTMGQADRENEPLGETNDDGTLWTMTPRQPVTITVFGDEDSAAFVDLTPREPADAIDSGDDA